MFNHLKNTLSNPTFDLLNIKERYSLYEKVDGQYTMTANTKY